MEDMDGEKGGEGMRGKEGGRSRESATTSCHDFQYRSLNGPFHSASFPHGFLKRNNGIWPLLPFGSVKSTVIIEETL